MNLYTRAKNEVVKYLCDQCKYQASWLGNVKQYNSQNMNGNTFM